MRLHRAFPLVLLVAALLAPAPASANHFAVRVDGSFTDAAGEGTFEGTLSLSRFERHGDRLVVVGSLDGRLTDATGKQLGEVEDRGVTATVDLGSLAASCERTSLRVGLEDLDAAGVRAHLQPAEVEIAANAVPGGGLQAPLCALAEAVRPSADLGAVAQRLEAVLAALG